MEQKDMTPQAFEAGLHQLIQQFGGLHPFIICGILTGMQHNILSTMREATIAAQAAQRAEVPIRPSNNGESVELSPGNKAYVDKLKASIDNAQQCKEASNILHLPPRGIIPVHEDPPAPPPSVS